MSTKLKILREKTKLAQKQLIEKEKNQNIIKNLIKLEIKIKASLISLKTIPRNKLLTNASDIRDLYDDTVDYIKRRSNEPEFENAYIMTRNLVNNLLNTVRELVELDEVFIKIMERNSINYIEKYKLYNVD